MGNHSIGVDVGGTKTAYGLFSPERKLLLRRQHPSDAHCSPEAFFDRMAVNVAKILREAGLGEDDLCGVGVGMPSFVNFEEGHILKTANLTRIRDFSARDYLRGKLGRGVRVVIDNDSHTGALAEHRHGAGRGFEHMLYCPVSTGISSGIVIDGAIFRGRYGWAGESGHMIVTPGEGLLCGCGNRGCLMSWCSGSMIVKHVRNWLTAGEKSALPALAGGAENISSQHISVAWEQGDALARRAVEQMAQYMAVWFFNLYVLLNIHCFVLGGGLLGMGEKLFGRVRELFDGYNQNDRPVFFREAELVKDHGIIGAAELLY